ncbi:MAG: RNA-binding transcriptional accessory protein [Kiritimatiellae bacterium]|nr:RNA-binding transcriptional accessory protein [Kiritimatiellia bacterium]
MNEDLNVETMARVAGEAGVTVLQVAAVARLLQEGNTVPFIARYRKEVHGNLDEVQILKVQERVGYYEELEERRAAILKSIEEQGKLTDDLRDKIEKCMVKSALEDLYLPYRPKRRTRAMIARERGLEPLADIIWAQGAESPDAAAAAFVDAAKDVPDAAAALAGARDICAERLADMAEVRGLVRQAFATRSVVKSSVVTPRPAEPTKFEQYYDFEERLADMPSHRFLAIRRGQAEGVLFMRLVVDAAPLVERIEEMAGVDARSPLADELRQAAADAYRRLVAPACELDVTMEKKQASDRAAVEVFAENLRNLLLASPLGEKRVLAIDPGIRTGCKVAMLDATGKFLDNTVIYPMQRPTEARETLARLVARFNPEAIAVGNGTAGRETEAFVRATLKLLDRKDVVVVSVSEAGASVYSASEIARDEFPDLDLTVRGAISIGRRLQDPLAELVKIDPKAIGVGQYQHDVFQPLLSAKLDEVTVSCVNKVGVELNTASAPLLTRVSGIGEALAKRIVAWRNENGAFRSRGELKKVAGLGPKAFEQSAGFLRIRGAANPLDSSGVHPERYALVETMAGDLGVTVKELVGNGTLASRIDVKRYVSAEVGEPTLRDILEELKKPGRDPRAAFERPAFREDVTTIDDVQEGMTLEGVVTNVTAFGAFVDIGIHQDGLVHVSELADRFVRDPAEVVKTGDKITVRVIGVDRDRGRVSLSARTRPRGPEARGCAQRRDAGPRRVGGEYGGRTVSSGFTCNPFADL